MSQENEKNNQTEETINSASDKIINDNTKKSLNKIKKGAGNAAKKVIKNPKVMAFIAAHFIPIIIIIAIIVAIIIVIGDVAFLLTMPGMIHEKIKETALGFWSNFTGWFTGDSTTAGINQEDIVGLAQYLQNMGYDIESYGLGTPEYEDNESYTKTLKKVGASADDKEYLKAYIAANENTYALAEVSIYGTLRQSASSIWRFVTMGQSEQESATDVSTGMINIINTNSLIQDFLTAGRAKPADYVKVDRKSKKMIIYTNAIYSLILDFLNINDGKIQWGSSFSFDMSNWTAKYGRPVELMLAIHLSTMMPDLSYRVATDKDVNTKVNIVLQDINMTYDTTVKTINGADSTLSSSQIIDSFLQYGLTGAENEYSESTGNNEEDNENTNNIDDDDETAEEESKTVKLNIYQKTYESIKDDPVKKAEFFKSIMNDSNSVMADIWGINILNALNNKEKGIGKFFSELLVANPAYQLLSRLFLDDYYVYIKHGKEIVPNLGITYDALLELAQITAKGLGDGIEHVKWPYIESVTNHWFYNDIDFSKGVYRKTATAKKKIHYEPASDESALNKEGIVVELDATLSADEGVVYQVCEPEAIGPNQAIIDIFSDSYYRYDGTIQTAKAIENAKSWSSINGYYDEEGNFIETPTVEKEKVSFEDNKASALAAFSMLENMHSEEGDFVYRNLKDLVVALKYLTKEDVTSELENELLWLIETDNKDEEWEVTKDGNKYGMTIKGVKGREVIAPENATITKDGDVVTLTFTPMSDDTKNLLEYIYADYYKTINKDAFVGMTMKIKGLENITDIKNVSRGDYIGTATGDLNVKMINIDKSLVEDVEIYMTQRHNHEYERRMKEKRDRPTAIGIDIGRASITTLDTGENSYTSLFDPNYEITSVTADQQQIFEMLKNSGYTYESTCVIMGVMNAESEFELGAVNQDEEKNHNQKRPGYGLLQWTNDRRTNLENWCQSNGYSYASLEGQMAFFNYELLHNYSQQYGYKYPVYETLMSSQNIEYALEMFLCHDEAGVNRSLSEPGKYASESGNNYTMRQMYEARLNYANGFYKYFQDQKY